MSNLRKNGEENNFEIFYDIFYAFDKCELESLKDILATYRLKNFNVNYLMYIIRTYSNLNIIYKNKSIYGLPNKDLFDIFINMKTKEEDELLSCDIYSISKNK